MICFQTSFFYFFESVAKLKIEPMMTLWPLTFEIITTFLLSAFLIYRYSNWAEHNIFATISVFISWFFSFLVIFILPLDISSTAFFQCVTSVNTSYEHSTTVPSQTLFLSNFVFANLTNNITTIVPSDISTIPQNPNDKIQENCGTLWDYASRDVLLNLWTFVYWTLQLLTWVILPLMQSYSMAGDFTPLGRLKSAFVENAIYYGTFGGLFFIILIYVAIRSSLDWAKLKVICTTASNTWGLFLLVILLGYGLIEIPRSCYYTSLHERSLEYLYFKIGKLSAEKCEAEEALDDILDEISSTYHTLYFNDSHSFNNYMEEILQKCPLVWRNNLIDKFQNVNKSNQLRKLAVTEKSLIRMNLTIKKAVQTHHRVQCQYMNVIKNAIELEHVGRNKMNITPFYKPALPNHRSTQPYYIQLLINWLYTPKVEWYWKCKIKEPFYAWFSFFLVALSVMVIWSEMVFSVQNPPLSIFAIIFNYLKQNGSYFLIELISIASIAYLCVCTYYTVFRIRVFNYYYLAPDHQTDEYSLIFAGMLLCRLTPPLCLNFLGLLNLDSYVIKNFSIEETAFTQIMGHMDVVPIISKGFNIYLPMIMCLFCGATFFQFGTRLLHFIGIEQFIIDDENTLDLIKEGRDLMMREQSKLLNENILKRELEPRTQNLIKFSSKSDCKKPNRKERRETSKNELLNDIESVDYPSSSTTDYRSFESRIPPKDLFDNI